MSKIRKPAVILADSMEEYMAPPNPYKNPPKGKLNLLELGRYAERVGKRIDELTAEEILQFKLPEFSDSTLVAFNEAKKLVGSPKAKGILLQRTSLMNVNPIKKRHNMDEESVALESTDWYKKMSAEMTPGKAIRADRGLRGWTQNVLAQKLGISIQNLSAMEHDRRPVSKKMATKLSQIFGVPPETYFKF